MLTFKEIDDTEAVARFGDEIIKRIYSDGGYSFVASSIAGCDAVREYAIKQEIPLVYTDIPAELLGELLSRYRHADVDALDPLRKAYRVAVKSEAQLLSEPVCVEHDEVVLSTITRADCEDYFRLCTDLQTNKYWSYDYREDNPDPDGEYFFREQGLDFARGAAITLAVRTDGNFIGEATIYGFDLSGGASVAIRLLPEWRSRGYGALALEAILDLGESIGLVRLYAEVMEDNAPSIALFSAYMDEVSREDGVVRFELIAAEC